MLGNFRPLMGDDFREPCGALMADALGGTRGFPVHRVHKPRGVMGSVGLRRNPGKASATTSNRFRCDRGVWPTTARRDITRGSARTPGHGPKETKHMSWFRSIWLLVLRGMLRHRRANSVMIATLALLAAVLIATLSLGYNLLISPWTYDSDRLGVLRHGVAGSGQERYGFAADEYRALRDSGIFESLVASQRVPVAFGDGADAASPRTLVRTSADMLAVTDARPLLGRFVQPGERGGERRLVMSHELWQHQFLGREDILGQSVLLDGERHEIVGIMPPRFHAMGGDFWAAHLGDLDTDTSTATNFVINFKLLPGVDIQAAQPRIDALAAMLIERAQSGRYPRGWAIMPMPVIDAVAGPLRPAMGLILAGAVALLLLGVLNVAALMVARQIADAGTIATRKALGESALRSVAVAFVESLLVAAAAMAAAVLAGRLLFDRFVGLIAMEWVPRELEGAFAYLTPALWTLPVTVLLIAIVLTLMRLPGLLRINAGSSLINATRTGGRRGEVAASRWLSGIQIAIAATILVTSLAIATGSRALLARDLGFDADGVQHTTLVFPRERFGNGGERIAAMDRMGIALERQGALAVAFTEAAPMQRYSRSGLITAATGGVLDEPLPVDYHLAHGDLAGALALRLLEGRFLDPRRDHAGSEPVVVVTRALASRLAAQGSALDRTLTLAGGNGEPVVRRVIGVVDDVRHESPLSPVRPTAYAPYGQDPVAATATGGQLAMLVRWPAGVVASNSARVTATIAAVDPWIAVHPMTAMSERADRSIAGITLARQLFGGFALLGVLLASLGIAAVAELVVARQRHEIAVRTALGASARQVLSSVLGGSARVAIPAALVGALMAWWLVDVLQAALQDSAAIEVSHALMAPALLLACALLATLLPAIRATRIQPLSLLQGR